MPVGGLYQHRKTSYAAPFLPLAVTPSSSRSATGSEYHWHLRHGVVQLVRLLQVQLEVTSQLPVVPVVLPVPRLVLEGVLPLLEANNLNSKHLYRDSVRVRQTLALTTQAVSTTAVGMYYSTCDVPVHY